MNPTIPTVELLINPLLNTLAQLGGSGSVEEIVEKEAYSSPPGRLR